MIMQAQLNALISFVEVGNGVLTFQLRGIEVYRVTPNNTPPLAPTTVNDHNCQHCYRVIGMRIALVAGWVDW